MADMEVDSGSAVIVPLNVMPLLDDTDFKAIETGLVYNSAGLVLTWNFQTTAGVMTSTAITATTSGLHDISEPLADVGMYGIEIPASGGNWANDGNAARIGTGWFTGVATGILPWRGPFIKFRAAAINNSLTDGATVDVNVTAMAANVVTAASIATDAIGSDELAASALTEIQASCDAAVTANTLVLDLPTTAEFNARTLAAADYVVTTDTIAGVTTATNVTTVNGLAANVITAASIATDADTEIQAACDAALVANNLDHLAKTATAAADMTTEVTDNTIISRLFAAGDTSTFVPSTMAISLLADDTEVAAATWAHATGAAVYAAAVTNAAGADIGADSTEILTRLPDATAGAAGGLFIAGTNAATSITTGLTSNIIGNVTGNLSGSVGSSTATDALVTTVDTVVDGIATSVAAFATTADIADAVHDETMSGHVSAGTFGAYVAFVYDWILNKLVTTDNGDGTYTSVLYADNGTTPLWTWTFTVASGTRSAAV